MSDEAAKVATFYDEKDAVEAELLSVFSTGQCKLRIGLPDGLSVNVVRHVDRVRPLNDKAREMLKGTG